MSGADQISPLPSVALLNNERVTEGELKVFRENGGELFANINEVQTHKHREGGGGEGSNSSKGLESGVALGDVGGGSGGGEMTMSEVSDFSREERTVSEVSDFSPSILPPQLTSSQSFMQPSTSSAPPYMCNPPPAYPQTTPPQLFCPPTPRPLRISTCTFLRLVF